MQLEGPNVPSLFTAVGAPRMVLYANSARDSGICVHSLAGFGVLVFAIENAYKAVRGSCGYPERIGFTDFNCTSKHGFQTYGYLRA